MKNRYRPSKVSFCFTQTSILNLLQYTIISLAVQPHDMPCFINTNSPTVFVPVYSPKTPREASVHSLAGNMRSPHVRLCDNSDSEWPKNWQKKPQFFLSFYYFPSVLLLFSFFLFVYKVASVRFHSHLSTDFCMQSHCLENLPQLQSDHVRSTIWVCVVEYECSCACKRE